MNEQKRIDFCLKYPEVVDIPEHSILTIQNMIDNNIKLVIDCFMVARYAELYGLYLDIFIKFKDIVNDFNRLIKELGKENNKS